MNWEELRILAEQEDSKCYDVTVDLKDCLFTTDNPSTVDLKPLASNLLNIPSLDRPFDDFRLTDWAMSQLCTKIGVPISYIRKCGHGMRCVNMDHWMHRLNKPVFLRLRETEPQHTIRAVLSDKYGVLNDHTVIKVMEEQVSDQLDVRRSKRSDDFTEIFTTDSLGPLDVQGPQGEMFRVGLLIQNSMIGKSAFRAKYALYRWIDDNRMYPFESGAVAGVSRRHIYLTEEKFRERVKDVTKELNNFRDGVTEGLEFAFKDQIPRETLQRLKYKFQELFGTSWVQENWPGLEQYKNLTRFTLADLVACQSQMDESPPHTKIHGARLAGNILAI